MVGSGLVDHRVAAAGAPHRALVWVDGRPVGLLGAHDPVKADAAEVAGFLRRWGKQLVVVSGDRRATVEAVAREVGIDQVVAEAFPEDKVAEVRRLQGQGRRVAFVGDGVNDAPALAQADVGIALGTGTDVAIEAADVLVMNESLRSVVDALLVARATFRVIAENLAWAFAYNVLMIPLAVAGILSPVVASAAMAASSVTVVGNALRLRRYRARRPKVSRPGVVYRDVPEEPVVELESMEALTGPARGHPEEVLPDAGSLKGMVRHDVGRAMAKLGELFEHQWEG